MRTVDGGACMAYERDARTAFASKALELSEMFMIKFGRRAFAGDIARVVKVEAPEESTGGGKRAREPISLVPAAGASGSTFVIGWMNVAENHAEIRAYHVLAEMHRQRFGRNLDLPRHDYEQFIDEARRFFSEEGIAFDLVQDAPVPPPARAGTGDAPLASPSASSSTGMNIGVVLLLLAVTVALGVGIGWFLFAPK